MSMKLNEVTKNLKIWRVASNELKKVARKRYNNISLFMRNNEDRLDAKTKARLSKEIGKSIIQYISVLYTVL